MVLQRSWVQILYRPEFFFRPYFRYCSNSVHYCEDRFHIHITRIVRQIVRRITNVILGDTGTREFHMAIN